ncbi:MAG TPA: O-methyltransferase [Steroidobacteraceae bacterium]|jgi:predicted O-methyltransferase YrrM|nr:O-methyltransferase [Steroidobacteraceae bacterium]
METEVWTKVDHWFNDRLVGADTALQAAVEATRVADIPEIQVSPTQGKFLMVLAATLGARAVLEIGTLAGYSTIWLARGVAAGGRVVTLERNEKHAEVARSNLQRAGMADRSQVRVGAASDSLKQLIAERADFDLVFIDADKKGYPDYLTAALQLTHAGSVIVADNVVRDGRVLDEAGADEDLRGIRRYIDMLGAEPRLLSTALQTVGEKGYDGFAISRVQR